MASSEKNLVKNNGDLCFGKVRVWDMDGKVSEWSDAAKFTISLLKPEDWKGEWILKKDQLNTDHNWYRKSFELNKTPELALVYIASFSYHELHYFFKQ